MGLQNEDGSFAGDKYGEIDTRFIYLAFNALSLLNALSLVHTSKSIDYIVQCRNFDGGFGMVPGAESHAGQIFTCVGALAIAGRLDVIDKDLLGWWLCERQLPGGGLNGRPQKLEDVCYSWWVLSSLAMIDRLHWVDATALTNFILSTQDDEGGFSDRPGYMPDVFHTHFALAGLSLLNYPALKPINAVYCLPEDVVSKIVH